MHLATIYLVWAGTWLSAYFIIVANSWMQHPVGYEINKSTGTAQANDIATIMFQKFAIYAYVHVILAGCLTGGFVVLGVAAWHLRQGRNVEVFRSAAKLAIVLMVPLTAFQLYWGNAFGIQTTKAQPMKIAATEALWDTEQPASFSIFQIGGFTQSDPTPSFSIEIPKLLSYLATGSFNGKVVGLNQNQAQERGAVRAGELHADDRARLLVHARDGLPRRPDAAARALGRLAALAPGHLERRNGSSGRRSAGSRCRSSPASAAGS